MRVLIDTTYALRGPSGTATYLRELAPALRALGVEVVEAANEARRPPAGGGLGSARNWLGDRRWTSSRLARLAAQAGADVLHHPLPALAPRAPVAQVVTVHDLAFETHPQLFDARFARWARRAHRRAARAAGAVVCVSQATARELRGRWGVPAERIVIAHHGPGQRLAHVARRAPEHVLYVGDDEPRKNLALVRGARLALPLRESAGAGPGALAELYAGALCLVHPSVAEGFGLTALEAMVAGVPVVAVRNPAVEEVCGDAAIYVGAADRAALEAAVARLQADPAERERLAARGRERAARFSWEACARAHVAAYERALRA